MAGANPDSVNLTGIIDDFASLVPKSKAAKEMMQNVYNQLKSVKDPRYHNFGFLPEYPHASTTAINDPDVLPVSADVNATMVPYFHISFDLLPIEPAMGWTIGRGVSPNRSVKWDLELPASDMIPAPSDNKLLGVKLQIDPISGLPTIQLLSAETIVRVAPGGEYKELVSGNIHTFTSGKNWCQICGIDFSIEHMQTSRLNVVIQKRNNYIQLLWPTMRDYMPIQVLDLYPHSFQSERGPAVNILTPIGCGGFGYVQLAIPDDVGGVRAVKRVAFKDKAGRSKAKMEVCFNKFFENCPGILTAHEVWCDHGRDFEHCESKPDRLSMLMPFAISSFRAHRIFSSLPVASCLDLFFQTLEGVYEMHSRNVMHRDITPSNLVIKSLRPHLTAAIIDLGNASLANCSWDTDITPFGRAPPEVMKLAHRLSQEPYDKRVDIFGWGLSVATACGFKYEETEQWATPGFYTTLSARVAEHVGSRQGLEHLANLLACMVAENPSDRPTIEEALDDPCWTVIQPLSTTRPVSGKKIKRN